MDYSHHLHQQKPQLPPGWVETIDPNTGRYYYANATTGESSWDLPRLQEQHFPPPPPQYSLQPSYQYPQQQQSNINHQYLNSYNIENNRINSEQLPAEDFYTYPNSVNHNSYNTCQPYPLEQQNLPQQAWSTMPTQPTHTANRSQNDVHNTSSYSVITGSNASMKEENDLIDNELRLLSVGQIADLCYMQQQRLQCDNNGTDSSGPPPYSAPLTIVQQQQRARQEVGRLQTRYYSLREQLKQFHIF
jgi:hypothetical protein